MPKDTLAYAKTMLYRQGVLYSHILDALGTTAPEHKRLSEALTQAHHEMFLATVISLKPELVIEVGAHDATFSRQVKQALPDTQVLAFEANPDVFAAYRQSVTAEGVDYRQNCVARTAGTVSFTIPLKGAKPRDTMGSLLHLAEEAGAIAAEVVAVTLDSVVGDADEFVLWIDAEGAAGDVLIGGAASLARCRAVLVEVETRPYWDGQMLDGQIFALLNEAGLVPVGRDVQRSWQYNAIFLRPHDIAAHYSTAALEGFIKRYVGSEGGVGGR